MQDKIKKLVTNIADGDFRALARGITIVENELQGYEELLLSLKSTARVRTIGITGPPGAGKSTLVNALINFLIKAGNRVGVLAVDPSSPFNYGALLGDRVRMAELYTHPAVYIRSLASRGALGGLSAKIVEIADVARQAPFDYLLIETVGVGQSEVEIAGLADCSIVTLVPEAGDAVQTLKAGIMEIADLFVVNKADREAADSLYRNLKTLAHERATINWELPVIKTVATKHEGIQDLVAGIESFFTSDEHIHEKKLQLLTEKTWQLIQAQMMRGRDRNQIKEELRSSLLQPDFNLYQFVKNQIGSQ